MLWIYLLNVSINKGIIMSKTRATTLCKRLNQAFPGCNAVTHEQWTGEYKTDQDGIWFRSEGEYAADGVRLYDYWSTEGMFHPALLKMVERSGFYLSPYDAGTLMAYRSE
jgi:hypothetical protein